MRHPSGARRNTILSAPRESISPFAKDNRCVRLEHHGSNVVEHLVRTAGNGARRAGRERHVRPEMLSRVFMS